MLHTYRLFFFVTNTLPTSGDDGVRQPSLQISVSQRGRNLLEPNFTVFDYFSAKIMTIYGSICTDSRCRAHFLPFDAIFFDFLALQLLCVTFSAGHFSRADLSAFLLSSSLEKGSTFFRLHFSDLAFLNLYNHIFTTFTYQDPGSPQQRGTTFH